MLCMQWINHNPLDNYRQNLLSYLVDSDLSNRKCYPPFEQLGPTKTHEVTHFSRCSTAVQLLTLSKQYKKEEAKKSDDRVC